MLSDIVLAQVTQEKFKELYNFWYSRLPNTHNRDTLEILVPVNASDYRTLVREFLESDYGDRISVNDHGEWKKYYKRKMKESDVDEIVNIAEGDRIKRGHLELYFEGYRFVEGYTKIVFVELEGRIIGYEMLFSNTQAKLFSWRGEFEFKKDSYIGLWIPNNT